MGSGSRKSSTVVALGVGAIVLAVAGSALAVPAVHSAINGSTIKNHSIVGKKLKNNTLTGKQIKESTLATVPNAAHLAGKSLGFFVASSRFLHIPRTAMAKGTTKTLGKLGPFTVTAKCVADGASAVAATMDIASTANWEALSFASDPAVVQSFTVADGPQPIASIDSSFSVADSEYPVIEVPSQPSAAIGGSGGVVAAVNDHDSGSPCVFWGDLQLDAP